MILKVYPHRSGNYNLCYLSYAYMTSIVHLTIQKKKSQSKALSDTASCLSLFFPDWLMQHPGV